MMYAASQNPAALPFVLCKKRHWCIASGDAALRNVQTSVVHAPGRAAIAAIGTCLRLTKLRFRFSQSSNQKNCNSRRAAHSV
jgi:hypothetical protein